MILKTKEEKFLAWHIRAEVVQHLGELPRRIESGQATTSEVALQIGKLLQWIGHTLDAGEHSNASINARCRDSVVELGEQFRQCGLTIYERNLSKNQTLASLRAKLESSLQDVSEIERAKR